MLFLPRYIAMVLYMDLSSSQIQGLQWQNNSLLLTHVKINLLFSPLAGGVERRPSRGEEGEVGEDDGHRKRHKRHDRKKRGREQDSNKKRHHVSVLT